MNLIKDLLKEYLAARGIEIPDPWFDGRDGLVEREYLDHLQAGKPYNTYHRTSQKLIAHLSFLEHDSGIQYLLDFICANIGRDKTILDYGCGIGSLGLRLLEAGYNKISFADVCSPSTDFLKWRLGKSYLDLRFIDLRDEDPESFEAVCCYNLLEHAHDPWKVFEHMEQWGSKIVMWLNTRFKVESEYQLHYNLDAFIERLGQERNIEKRQDGDGYKLFLLGKT